MYKQNFVTSRNTLEGSSNKEDFNFVSHAGKVGLVQQTSKIKKSKDAVIVGSSLMLHNSLFFVDKITIEF